MQANQAKPETKPEAPLLEQLERAAREIYQAGGCKLTSEVQVAVKIHPGNLVTVQYVARFGEWSGPNDLVIGDSILSVTEQLIPKIQNRLNIHAQRLAKLRKEAAELGVEIGGAQ